MNSIAFSQALDPISGTNRKFTSHLWSLLSNYIGLDNVLSSLQSVDELDIQIVKGMERSSNTNPLSLGLLLATGTVPIVVTPTTTYSPAIQRLTQQLGFMNPESCCYYIYHLFLLFSAGLSNQLTATDDAEFFDEQLSMSKDALQDLISLLRKVLLRLFVTSPVNHTKLRTTPCDFGTSKACISHAQLQRSQFLMISTKLFNALFARYERRAFAPAEHWQWNVPRLLPDDINTRDDSQLPDIEEVGTLYAEYQGALDCIPQVFAFDQRLKLFQFLLRLDSKNYQPSMHQLMTGSAHGVGLRIRRDQIVQDAFEGLAEIDVKRLKGRIQVEFTSEQGYTEAGIDGGGLFKAFLDSFMKAAFDPIYGLFVPNSDQLLTPNPASSLILTSHLPYMNFLGKMMGIAIYNRILVEPQFAAPFLNILLGRFNSFDDLWSLDKEVHRSLIGLKNMKLTSNSNGSTTSTSTSNTTCCVDSSKDQGEDPIANLGLNFTLDKVYLDVVSTEELIPNGATIPVTSENVLTFIHRFANYKLNVETAPQCRAFLAGFRSIIPGEWMRLFSPREMQLLISGDDQRMINIADFRNNVNYAGGYHDSQPYIQAFWSIIESLDTKQQGLFMKFVTSCSRPPLLGFAQLNPKFGIQRVPAVQAIGDAPRLPSAATCMNLLKLPQYDSIDMLREKLLYAISSNSGFELS